MMLSCEHLFTYAYLFIVISADDADLVCNRRVYVLREIDRNHQEDHLSIKQNTIYSSH